MCHLGIFTVELEVLPQRRVSAMDKQLLEGLRQLLLTCDNPSESPAQDTWAQVAKGGKPRKRGKGKGAGGEFGRSDNFQNTPSSPRRVTFDTVHTEEDGDKTLLAQLRALILKAEVDQGFQPAARPVETCQSTVWSRNSTRVKGQTGDLAKTKNSTHPCSSAICMCTSSGGQELRSRQKKLWTNGTR